jgi:cytochrome c oxidase assembly factor 1
MPEPVVYDRVARPRSYYQRPVTKRDLPVIAVRLLCILREWCILLTAKQSRWPALLAFGLAGVAAWGGFIAYATNQERLSSSVVRQILVNLRDSPLVVEALGEGIRPEPAWYLNGDPWINGSVCHLATTNDAIC